MQRLEVFAIGGVAGFAINFAYILASDVGVSSGEWLQFAGVFLGVMMTIFGTLWLQRHARRRRAEQQLQGLNDAVEAFALVTARLGEGAIESATAAQAMPQMLEHVEWALDRVDECSYGVYSSCRLLRLKWDHQQPVISKFVDVVAAHPDSGMEQMLRGEAMRFAEAAKLIKKSIADDLSGKSAKTLAATLAQEATATGSTA